mmetsp:Transcript_14864/g.21947  ORF Transcript_14864/g.21947 Transcript_14864/m.21947 type:complete len:332 (+) Transcript_14864:228-1223(+)
MIGINRSPNIGLLPIIQLNPIRIALIPLLNHDTLLPLSNIRTDLSTNGKPQRLIGTTRQKPFTIELMIQILANEYKTRFTLFTLFPRGALLKSAVKEHAHALKDEFDGHAFDGNHALVSVQIGTVSGNHTANPLFEHLHIDVGFDLDRHARYGGVVLMFLIFIEKLGVEIEDTLEFKGLNVKNVTRIDLALLGALNRGRRIDFLELTFNLGQFRVIGQIDLVQQNFIGKGHLFYSLVLHTFRFDFGQTFGDVLGVHHGNDAIKSVHIFNHIINEERLTYGCRIRQSSRFDNDAIELLDTFVQFFERFHKISAYGAADASVHDFDDLFVDVF